MNKLNKPARDKISKESLAHLVKASHLTRDALKQFLFVESSLSSLEIDGLMVHFEEIQDKCSASLIEYLESIQDEVE